MWHHLTSYHHIFNTTEVMSYRRYFYRTAQALIFAFKNEVFTSLESANKTLYDRFNYSYFFRLNPAVYAKYVLQKV